jgi:hypothetical protein
MIEKHKHELLKAGTHDLGDEGVASLGQNAFWSKRH